MFRIEEYGYYSILLNLCNWGGVIANLGIPKLVLKSSSISRSIKFFSIFKKGLLQFIFLVAFIMLLSIIKADIGAYQMIIICSVGISSLVYQLITKAYQGINSLSFSAVFSDSLLSIMVQWILILLLLLMNKTIEPETLVLTIAVSNLISICILLLYLKTKNLLDFRFNQTKIVEEFRVILSNSYQLYIIELINRAIILLPLLIFPFFLSSKEIGVFGFAEKLGMISTTVLTAINFWLAPEFRKLSKQGRSKDIGVLYKKTIKKISLFCFFFFIILMINFEYLITLINEEYLNYKLILYIYMLAHFINTIFGPVGWILIMTDNEKKLIINNLISVGIFIFSMIFNQTSVYLAFLVLIMIFTNNILNYQSIKKIGIL